MSSAVPVARLEFTPRLVIPGVAASPAIALPILCAPDGTPFISVPVPPTYTTQAVYSLDQKGAHTFSYESAPGLYDAHFLGFFPGDSIVGVLVTATEDAKKSQFTVESPAGTTTKTGSGFRGEHHEYIVEFDRNGNYRAKVELPTEYSFRRVAELPDGTLLALGYDHANAVARLLLLDSSGEVIRELEIPAGMQDRPELKQGETGGALNRARAETSLSWWLFAPARHRVLLYVAHSTAPVFDIGAGGAVREVPLEVPKGYVLDGVIPANDRWIMRYRRTGLSDRGEIDVRPQAGNFVYYEVNPEDGSLQRQLEIVSGPGFGIACEQDGVLTGFSVSPDSKYLRMTADLPH